MERRLLILLIGLFLMVDMVAILIVYNNNFISDGNSNNEKQASITSYGATSFTSSDSYSESSSSSKITSSALSGFSGSYAGEYVNMGSCGCG